MESADAQDLDNFFDIIQDEQGDFTHSEVKPFEVPTNFGLISTLQDHQKVAVAWMLEREKTPAHFYCRGGLIMDEAGLGKTLETLTLIKANPTPPGFPTLVVAPASLIHVWSQEIKKHFQKNTFQVYHYYGQHRINEDIDWILLNHDIILTSYGTLVSEYHKTKQAGVNGPIFWQETKNGEQFRSLFDQTIIEAQKTPPINIESGLWRGIKFGRIVLDEVHHIKNASSIKSKAIRELRVPGTMIYSTNPNQIVGYTWILTATLLHNRLDDMYTALDFLNVFPYSGNYALWRTNIVEVIRKVDR